MRYEEVDEYGNPIVIFPAHWRPLPDGYRVVQLDSGHFMWETADGTRESGMDWNPYRVRRGCFDDAKVK